MGHSFKRQGRVKEMVFFFESEAATLLAGGVGILLCIWLVFLIFERLGEVGKEDFEKRDN